MGQIETVLVAEYRITRGQFWRSTVLDINTGSVSRAASRKPKRQPRKPSSKR